MLRKIVICLPILAWFLLALSIASSEELEMPTYKIVTFVVLTLYMLLFAYANSTEYKTKRKKIKKEENTLLDLDYCRHHYSDGKSALIQFGDECECNICGKKFNYKLNLKNK